MELKFNIKDISLLECHFKVNPEYRFKDKPVNISSSIDIQLAQDTKNVQVIISVNSDKKEQPFIFNIVLSGLFCFEEMLPQNELERVAHINCAAIVFPYIRETVADITRRAGLPPFHMGPINFIKLYEAKQEVERSRKRRVVKARKSRGKVKLLN